MNTHPVPRCPKATRAAFIVILLGTAAFWASVVVALT